MAKHILRIVYSREELNSLPDDNFQQNQAIFRAAPFNPLPELALKDVINQFSNYNRPARFKTTSLPFSLLQFSGTSADGKNSLNIYVEGR